MQSLLIATRQKNIEKTLMKNVIILRSNYHAWYIYVENIIL